MLKSTLTLSFVRGLNIVFTALTSIIIARMLGVEARGFYALGTTLFVLAMSAGMMGAEIRVRLQGFQFQSLGHFFKVYKKLFLFGWLVATVLLTLLLVLKSLSLSLWLYGVIVVGLACAIWQEMLYALYHIQGKIVRPILLASVGSYVLTTGLLLLLAWQQKLTVDVALALFVLQICIAVGFYVVQNVPLTPTSQTVQSVKILPPYLNTLMNVLTKRVDILLLSFVGSLSAVGHYAVANSIFEIMTIPAVILGQTFLNAQHELQRKYLIYGLYAVLCVVALIFIAPYLVLFLFGTDFMAAAEVMPYFALLVVPVLGWTYVQGMLWRHTQQLYAISPVMLVALAKLVFIPLAYNYYGLSGVIIASAGVYALGSMLSFILYRRAQT